LCRADDAALHQRSMCVHTQIAGRWEQSCTCPLTTAHKQLPGDPHHLGSIVSTLLDGQKLRRAVSAFGVRAWHPASREVRCRIAIANPSGSLTSTRLATPEAMSSLFEFWGRLHTPVHNRAQCNLGAPLHSASRR
jgi:hypothetical protein